MTLIINAQTLKQEPDPLNASWVARMIDDDLSIGTNYQRLSFSEAPRFLTASLQMTDEFIESIIRPMREPVRKVFGRA